MSPLVLGVIAMIGALAVPIGAYLAVVRRTSGRIETTEASKLWEEAGKMRSEYRDEIEDLRATVSDLREQNAELRKENNGLRRRENGEPDVVGHAMPSPNAPATKRGVQRALWVNALAISAVLVVLAIAVGAVYAVRSHDLDAQLARNRDVSNQQRRTIRYLCQSVVLQDATVVQQAAFLRVVISNKQFNQIIGPNEREFLRQRAATLLAIHDELSSQRAQRACKDF